MIVRKVRRIKGKSEGPNMRLPLTLIFFVILGTENTSPALLVLEIVTFLRLGRHDGGWSNSSLFLAAGSMAVLSNEELQKEAKISIFKTFNYPNG